MTIYRSFRFGAHLELMMTDQRSYRSDHAIPESPDFGAPLLFDERNALPMEFVNVFDAGRTANGGSPPAIVLGKDNPRTMAPPGSMLGAEQKAWMKASLAGSNATWKLWGNPVPMMRVKIKPGPVAALAVDRVLNGDGWDGYPGERNEMLTYLRTQDIKNVLVITGDWHAHFAATLMDNYDAASPMPVGVEFIAAGITSNSLFSFFEFATRAFNGTTLRDVITFDGSSAGLGNFVENMNVLCMHGATAALNFKDTKNLATALGMSDATQNPHLKYADTNAQGYGTLTITSTQTTARLVTVERPVAGTGAVKRVAAFTVPKDNPAGMTGPTFTGTKPVPY
jgi:alkaline phosphatase D